MNTTITIIFIISLLLSVITIVTMYINITQYKAKTKNLEHLLNTGNEQIYKMRVLIKEELNIGYCAQCFQEIPINSKEKEPKSMDDYYKQQLCIHCYNDKFGYVGIGTGQ